MWNCGFPRRRKSTSTIASIAITAATATTITVQFRWIRWKRRTNPRCRRPSSQKSRHPTNLRAGRFLAPQWQEILRTLDRRRDFFQQFLQVFVAIDKVDLGRVHDQQVGLRVVKEKMFVGLHHFHQVILADGLLAGRVLFLQPLLQHFRRGLQIDDQVGRRNLFAKIIEVAIVRIEFLIVEVEAGEELVFFKNVIGDDGLIRPRPQIERPQLLKAADQECQLGLEGSARFAFVKCLQKWIVFRLDDALGRQSLSENPRQCALPNSYGTFDRNVTGKLEKLGHRFVISDWRRSSGTGKQNISLRLPAQCGKSWREEVVGRLSLVVRDSSWAIATCLWARGSCQRLATND